MNKLLIVLLAVCLFSVVSAHTFVKRDAPTAPADDVMAQLKAMTAKFTEMGDDYSKQLSNAVNSDELMKHFNAAIDAATKAMDQLKLVPAPAVDAKPAA